MISARSFPTQTEIERAIRAAKKTGATAVSVRPDGSIVIELVADAESDLVDRRKREDEILAKLE